MTQRVVSIVGPTASGKTGLGIAIARRLAEAGERAEIVNADAYQMYRGMDIGTAKPTAEEQAAVPHHLHRHHRPRRGTMSGRPIPAACARATIARPAITRHPPHSRRRLRPVRAGPPSTTSPSPAPIPTCARDWRNASAAEGAGALFDELRAKDPRGRRRAWTPATRAAPSARWRSSKLTGQTVFRQSAPLPVRHRRPCRSDSDLPRPELDQRIDIAHQADAVTVGSSKRSSGCARIWEPPPGGRWAISRVIDLPGRASAIWTTPSRDIAQKTKRLARKQMGWFGRDPRIHWLPGPQPATGRQRDGRYRRTPTPATTTRSTRRADEYTPSIIWATCSNGRAARRRPVPRGDRHAESPRQSVVSGPLLPAGDQEHPRRVRRGARCRVEHLAPVQTMSPRYAGVLRRRV